MVKTVFLSPNTLGFVFSIIARYYFGLKKFLTCLKKESSLQVLWLSHKKNKK